MPPLEFLFQPLLYGVLIPAVVAAVLLLPVRLRRATRAAEARAFGALAAAGGVVAGYAALNLSPLHLDLAGHWPWLALAAAAVGGSALPGGMRAVLLPGLLAAGRFYSFSDVPLSSYVLAAAAPLGLAIPELPGLRALPARVGALLRALAVLGLLAIPAVPAVIAVVRELQAEG